MSTPTDDKPAILPSPLNPTGAPPQDDAARGQARIRLLDIEQWLARLTENDDFKRYLAFVKEGAEAVETQAGDIGAHTTEQGYALAQRFFGLNAMLKWPERQLAAVRAQIAVMDKWK